MMGRILFAWQLGAGNGHLMRMLPLVEGLVANGHEVFVAARYLARAAAAYGKARVRLLQAPYKTEGPRCFPRAISFAHLIANTGFGERFTLFGIASAWRNLFRLIRPDLIVFDHTPAGL